MGTLLRTHFSSLAFTIPKMICGIITLSESLQCQKEEVAPESKRHTLSDLIPTANVGIPGSHLPALPTQNLITFNFHHKIMHNETSVSINKFSSLFEPDLLAELETKSMQMEVHAGQTMLNIGQNIKAVPILISGTLKVSRINDEGQELLLYYVREGESCAMTFTCCVMAQTSAIKGVAEEDSVLLCVPVSLMEEWMIKYPSWKKYVMTTIYNRFTELVKSIDDIAFKKLDDRLVIYLKEKSKATGSSLINLSHQQIADELGTNRVVVSRLLKQLEIDKKLLLYRSQIKLLKDL